MQTATDTRRATQHASPDRRKLIPSEDNAYRVLGLSCHASQREIYASAATLRRAIKLGVAKPSAHHVAWLGSHALTENGVRDALSRLTVPAQRIYERLFWFFDPQTAVNDDDAAAPGFASLRESVARLQAEGSPAARHDAALLSLAVMLRLDPALELADDWRRAFALWKELIEGREFWSLLMAADLKGDFEQATTFGEIGGLRGRAWRLVTAPLAETARDAMLREDHAQAGRALAVLRAAGMPPTVAGEYEHEILGSIEDEFDVLLSDAFIVYRYEVKSTQNIAERRATCWSALGKFNERVRPALKKILDLAGSESDVARRMFAAAADALDELSDGFETGYDNDSRVKMLRRAWQLAPPESASLLLIEEHLAAAAGDAGDATERPPKTEADYARQLVAALRKPVAQELFTAYIQQGDAERKLDAWGKGAMKFVFLVMVALFVGKCFNSLPGSRRMSGFRPTNFNIALPQFTPPPMSELPLTPLASYITPRELQGKLKAKTVTLLHLGARGEYETGHIPGALNVTAAELAARAARLPKRRQIVIYCSCGEQEAIKSAAFELVTLGFYNVSVLEGGYRAWLDAGLPVEPRRPPTETRKSAALYETTN
jgi:rhodanese-related sulfurtransferase